MRLHGYALTILLLLPLAGFAADKEKEPVLYPLVKGNKWEYTLKVGGKTLAMTTELTAASTPDKKDAAPIFTLTTIVNDKTSLETLSTNSNGVYRHSTGANTFDTPLQILQYPVKNGAKWSQKVAFNKKETRAEFELQEPVEVTVPAGKFKAYPVVYRSGAEGQTVELTSWYADGVGVVKMQLKSGGNTSTMELKKFTPAK